MSTANLCIVSSHIFACALSLFSDEKMERKWRFQPVSSFHRVDFHTSALDLSFFDPVIVSVRRTSASRVLSSSQASFSLFLSMFHTCSWSNRTFSFFTNNGKNERSDQYTFAVDAKCFFDIFDLKNWNWPTGPQIVFRIPWLIIWDYLYKTYIFQNSGSVAHFTLETDRIYQLTNPTRNK